MRKLCRYLWLMLCCPHAVLKRNDKCYEVYHLGIFMRWRLCSDHDHFVYEYAVFGNKNEAFQFALDNVSDTGMVAYFTDVREVKGKKSINELYYLFKSNESR